MPRLSSAYQAVLRSLVDSEKINRVSWGAEALYVRLLLVADGAGRYHGSAGMVAGKVATKRLLRRATDLDEIEGFLVELESVGLIYRYGCGEFLGIVDFFAGGANGEGRGIRRAVAFPASPDGLPQPVALPPSYASGGPDRRSEIGDLDRRSERRSGGEPNAAAAGPPTVAEPPVAVPVDTPPKKPKKPRKQPTGDHPELIAWWCAEWERTRGFPFVVRGGPDGSAAKAALKLGTLAECQARTTRLLEAPDDFTRKAVDGIAWLGKRWNTLGGPGQPGTAVGGSEFDKYLTRQGLL